MKGLFSKISAKSQNILSKQDKKKINSKIPNILDLKAEYKVFHVSSKLKLYGNEDSIVLFEYYDRLFPTIHSFNKDNFKRVTLDSGAMGPLMRGADVMCPGVLKYKELSDKFENNEIVGIEILDHGITGVGVTNMSYDDMIKLKEGSLVSVYHVKGDCVDLNTFTD